MTQVPSTMDLEAVHEAAIVVAHHRLGRRVKGVDLAQRSDRTRILRVKRQMRLGATGEEIADEICTILVGSIAVMRFTGSSEIKSLEAEEFAWERRQLARLQQSLRLSPEDFRFHRDRGFARAKRVTGRNFMAIKEVTQAILIAPGNRLSGRDVRRIIDANPEDPTMCQFDRHVALHESAHAVVAIVLGFDVNGITLLPGGSGFTEVVPEDASRMTYQERRAYASSFYAQAAAGIISDSDAPSSWDQFGHQRDLEGMQNMNAEMGLSDMAFEDAVEEAKRTARTILEQYADSVKKVAAEAQRSGHVDGRRIRQIVKESSPNAESGKGRRTRSSRMK